MQAPAPGSSVNAMGGVALLLVVCCAALTVPAVASSRVASDSSAVATVIQQQNAAFNAGRWQALWSLYGPRFKARCNYSRWVTATKQARAQILPAKIRTSVTRVRVSGSNAYATYDVFVLGQRVHTVGDLYVKVGGRWRDELDAHTPCGY
jgi:hypothetical protein